MTIRTMGSLLANPEAGGTQRIRDPERVGLGGVHPQDVVYSPIPVGEGPTSNLEGLLNGGDTPVTTDPDFGDPDADWVQRMKDRFRGFDPGYAGLDMGIDGAIQDLNASGIDINRIGDLSGFSDWQTYLQAGISDPTSLVGANVPPAPPPPPGTTRETAGQATSEAGNSSHGTGGAPDNPDPGPHHESTRPDGTVVWNDDPTVTHDRASGRAIYDPGGPGKMAPSPGTIWLNPGGHPMPNPEDDDAPRWGPSAHAAASIGWRILTGDPAFSGWLRAGVATTPVTDPAGGGIAPDVGPGAGGGGGFGENISFDPGYIDPTREGLPFGSGAQRIPGVPSAEPSGPTVAPGGNPVGPG